MGEDNNDERIVTAIAILQGCNELPVHSTRLGVNYDDNIVWNKLVSYVNDIITAEQAAKNIQNCMSLKLLE